MRLRDAIALQAALTGRGLIARIVGAPHEAAVLVEVPWLRVLVDSTSHCRISGDYRIPPTRRAEVLGPHSCGGYLDGGACSACSACPSVRERVRAAGVPAVDRWRGRGWPDRIATELQRFAAGVDHGVRAVRAADERNAAREMTTPEASP